jgi:dienelactone hydrolase
MKTQKLEYTSGATRLLGELFWDAARTDRRPGVLVFPEAFGLNDHARERARRLADLGFVALAADLHGEGRVYPDLASLRPAITALYEDRVKWRGIARAARDALVAQPQVDADRIAAIGFCFGGATCFELARTGAPVSAIVTFHAGLTTELPGDAGRIRAKVLVCHGAEDPIAKKEAIDAVVAELRRDKVDWQLVHYGNAAHSFTEPAADARGMPGFAYNATVTSRSWKLMRDLFEEAFAW